MTATLKTETVIEPSSLEETELQHAICKYLPEKLAEEANMICFFYYCELEGEIIENADLAGIKIVDKDYNDQEWGRWFEFETWEDARLFVAMTDWGADRSDWGWDSEEKSVEIPRLDLWMASVTLHDNVYENKN